MELEAVVWAQIGILLARIRACAAANEKPRLSHDGFAHLASEEPLGYRLDSTSNSNPRDFTPRALDCLKLKLIGP